jgi:hypothetical protein
MASPVDISNLALGFLGDVAEVTNISPPEGSAQAEHCSKFYPQARDEVISLVEPSWAKQRIPALALIEPDEQPDIWTYAYSAPNAIRVLSIGLPEATLVDADRQEWDQEALADGSIVIYTNTELATARILARITDTTKFGPLFTRAVVRLLASYLAGPVIKGMEGMKVGGAHYDAFIKHDLPQAIREARVGRSNQYRDFIPSSLKARG